jgi:hypothetical protein
VTEGGTGNDDNHDDCRQKEEDPPQRDGRNRAREGDFQQHGRHDHGYQGGRLVLG